jgi:hypothetical protein
MELEDDLPEFETLTTSCQTLEKRRWEENMEHDRDISPQQSPLLFAKIKGTPIVPSLL